MANVILDLDGVLVDFMKGALRLHKVHKSVEDVYKSKPGWTGLDAMLGVSTREFFEGMEEDFWSNLEWMPNGEEIVGILEETFGRGNITIWTSPSKNLGCKRGKELWVEKHLHPHYSRNLDFVGKKWLGANPNTVLVDDMDHQVNKFKKLGGLVIQPARIWNQRHSISNFWLMDFKGQLEEVKWKLKNS